MIATMTDETFKDTLSKYEGAPLLALFMALYSFRANGKKVNSERYELVKAKVIDRLNSAIKEK